MLDFLKNFGGSKPWQNKVGLGEEALDFLVQDLNALEKLEPDLPARVLRYVLDGEGEEVLTALAATAGASEVLGFSGPFGRPKGYDQSIRIGFFERVRCADPGFFIRLGKTYEAALGSPAGPGQARLLAQYPQLQAVVAPPGFADPRLNWLSLLLAEATQLRNNTWPRHCVPCPALTADLLEAMLQAEGHAPEFLVRSAFAPQLPRYGVPPLEPFFATLEGLAQSAVRHQQVLLEALGQSDFKQRVYALGRMQACKVPVQPFAEKLVELALGTSKQASELATVLLAEAKPAARPFIEQKLRGGGTEERAGAVRLFWEWEGEGARALLQSRLAEEKNKKVLRTLEEVLAVPAASSAPATNAKLELPPLPPMPSEAPLGPETEQAWQQCFQKVNQAIARFNASQAGKPHAHLMKPLDADAIGKSFALIQSGGATESLFPAFAYGVCQRELSDPFREFWQRPEPSLVHLVRFLIHLGSLQAKGAGNRQVLSYGRWLELLLPVFRRTHPQVGLRELAAAFTLAGLDPQHLGCCLLQSYFETPAPLGLPPELLWPYWAENLELLEQALAPVGSTDFMERFSQRYARRNAFQALATFPAPPERLVSLLWKVALGAKSERPPAQRCLEGLPDKLERLLAALSAGEAETRLAAAEWLGRLGDARAVAPLLTALKREKNETAKGTMMAALERLGASVDQFLDRKALLVEAEKGVAKGVSEDLKWFPFEQLPAVHWSDNGQLVEPAILKWWLIQGFKLKNPEPGPLLRRYCASLKTAEREALGQFVLEAWLAEDISPISRAEAEKRAMQLAQQSAQWCQSAYWPKNSPKKTVEEFYADFLAGQLVQPKGSAASSKGILSLVGACAGAGAAPTIGRYLKQWYGMRAAQCRALLQMLVWVEHKTATQLLLAVGSRFRTKGIQEEAARQAQALAERKGWTVAELADRTIPTAGLDDEGVLTLDFGPRQFAAKLNAALEFALADAEGNPLKSLPDPRKDDDEAKAAEAKKTFSAAKKELKSVLALQRERLYEAMCTQRTWPFEDWNLFLNRHPVACHLCQRLVWAVVRDEKVVTLFRPLPDGSLTNADDDAVTLNPEDRVRIAHECQVAPEQSAAWRQHLKDYEVEPLFEQFGRPNFALDDPRKQEEEMADFRGHLLEAFRLRGRANKLGYTRGQPQDGGWFFDYRKRFPTLGLEAVLEFSGNGLPEENRAVALTTFRFERAAVDGEPVSGGAGMPLGEVPPVLLSECWNDLRQIAAEGKGFDPEWEKKVQL